MHTGTEDRSAFTEIFPYKPWQNPGRTMENQIHLHVKNY